MELTNLPALTGTDNQVAYAAKIRNAVILARRNAVMYEAMGGRNSSAISGAARTTAAIDWDNADAAYWLGHFAKRVTAIDWTADDWDSHLTRSADEMARRNAYLGETERYAALTTLAGQLR